ncbi:MAG: SCP2 sterol-binding domain-containing protein [Cyanobacteria bacterium]|nr:SCP2 sterol-binding domain-containing protein [Cyanobacteriota bacterium]
MLNPNGPFNNKPQQTSQPRYYQTVAPLRPPEKLDASWLKDLARELGADDVGLVEVGRHGLETQADEVKQFFPKGKMFLSIVCRMNREPIRSPARSVANLEFHSNHEHVNQVTHTLVRKLESLGIEALAPSMGFPMEAQNFPDEKGWVLSHKPIAVAAGLGQMGIHRNVIHPQFGNFILLSTVVLNAEATAYDGAIDFNPCMECKLCVAACPVGAISPEGDFNFSACFTHNYREFMGGFQDWVETIADSPSSKALRQKMTPGENASFWQSLSFGAQYKAAYCMAVCPAGEDVIAPFLANRTQFLQDTLRPLQDKVESVYVVPGSDAEAHVKKRFPHKQVRLIGSGIYPGTIAGFLRGLSLSFQREQARGMCFTLHFTFTGKEPQKATVIVNSQKLTVQEGHEGKADTVITVDSQTWLGIINQEISPIRAILTGKFRLKGQFAVLKQFQRCFPK